MKKLAKQEFGRRLRAAIDAEGLTQKQLADALDVKPASVSRWASGIDMPEEGHFQAICAHLRKPPEYFMGAAPAPLPPTLEGLQRVIADQEKRLREFEAIMPRDLARRLVSLNPDHRRQVLAALDAEVAGKETEEGRREPAGAQSSTPNEKSRP